MRSCVKAIRLEVARLPLIQILSIDTAHLEYNFHTSSCYKMSGFHTKAFFIYVVTPGLFSSMLYRIKKERGPCGNVLFVHLGLRGQKKLQCEKLGADILFAHSMPWNFKTLKLIFSKLL